MEAAWATPGSSLSSASTASWGSASICAASQPIAPPCSAVLNLGTVGFSATATVFAPTCPPTLTCAPERCHRMFWYTRVVSDASLASLSSSSGFSRSSLRFASSCFFCSSFSSASFATSGNMLAAIARVSERTSDVSVLTISSTSGMYSCSSPGSSRSRSSSRKSLTRSRAILTSPACCRISVFSRSSRYAFLVRTPRYTFWKLMMSRRVFLYSTHSLRIRQYDQMSRA